MTQENRVGEAKGQFERAFDSVEQAAKLVDGARELLEMVRPHAGEVPDVKWAALQAAIVALVDASDAVEARLLGIAAAPFYATLSPPLLDPEW